MVRLSATASKAEQPMNNRGCGQPDDERVDRRRPMSSLASLEAQHAEVLRQTTRQVKPPAAVAVIEPTRVASEESRA